METFTIDVLHSYPIPYFIIKGKIIDLISNKRLLLSLKRLDYRVEDDSILIPFRFENQINSLRELQNLLNKNELAFELTPNAKDDVKNYDRENKLFEEFSQKAKLIRDDEFKNHQELIENYIAFKANLDKTIIRDLYPLQELSAFHMAFAQNSCNFAVPGAGKTSIVYGAYSYLKSLSNDDPKKVDKLLVIGPISSFAPWEKEYILTFGKPTTFQRLSGDISLSKNKKLEHLYSGSPAEITLIFHGGVDVLQDDIIEFLKSNKTMLVVDEAHRIKNPEGVWGKSITEISKEARSRVVLTGTPLPNGYQDIFNLYKFIYPFKFRDIIKIHYQNLEEMTISCLPDSERVLALKENLSPFFIRIKKPDLMLPPIEEKVIQIDMDRSQREIYDFIETTYVKTFRQNNSATIKDILNRAKLIRLRQAATNPSLLSRTLRDSLANNEIAGEIDPNSRFTTHNDEFIEDSEFFFKICNYNNLEIPKKFKIILNLLNDEVFNDHGKAIIWTIFIQNAKDLQAFLGNNGVLSKLLIGEIEPSEREKIIEKFNDAGNNEFNVLIANPFAVAESISLHHGCHNAIYLERDYNCSNFIQSKDRIHRVGLLDKQITKYYYLISNNSIDEVIYERLKIKIARMESIINDDIPLFRRIIDDDETDIIKDLIANYANRT
jgi:SNF2 family DNA or RNA helicase